MQPDEKRIIERCKLGDAAAFNELVLRYEKQVYNLAYRLTGNYDDANDVASDTFVRIYNSISKFRGDSAFSTWLYRIVTNVYLDSRKRRSAHPNLSLEEYLEMEEGSLERQVEDDTPGPHVKIEERERHERLMDAIHRLPEFQRIIILLYHIQELPYEEISEILDMPLGTVKSRLNRARRALKELLVQQRELFGA
ncbi:MAG: sigma-70 family RNA polymerase sigma factor [Armatimonadetes bacterium]|nr:sigma-70 family RNA polymerase sigma factor [Armatimonadota bacterium]